MVATLARNAATAAASICDGTVIADGGIVVLHEEVQVRGLVNDAPATMQGDVSAPILL